MATKDQQSTPSTIAQADPECVQPGEGQIAFLKGAVGNGTVVIREGQSVSYELAKGPDGLWYAINIVVEDEPYLN